MRERPDDELFADQRPKPRQPVRFDDQEKDDQRADDHDVQMFDGGTFNVQPQPSRQNVQHHRQRDDQDRAHVIPKDRAPAHR